jgi:hypothetical protein
MRYTGIVIPSRNSNRVKYFLIALVTFIVGVLISYLWINIKKFNKTLLSENVCNLYTGQINHLFYKRCGCLGRIIRDEKKWPVALEPSSKPTEYCRGLIYKVYYVLDANEPEIKKNLGVVKVKNKTEAYEVCSNINEVFSHHTEDSCRYWADKVIFE